MAELMFGMMLETVAALTVNGMKHEVQTPAAEAWGWLQDFRKTCMECMSGPRKEWTRLLHSFVQLGVDAPTSHVKEGTEAGWACMCEKPSSFSWDSYYRDPSGRINLEYHHWKYLSIGRPDKVDANTCHWIHCHHAAYNQAVYAVLKDLGLIRGLRKALQADLRSVGKTYEDGTEYGKVCHKAYAKMLLDNFLTDHPTWLN